MIVNHTHLLRFSLISPTIWFQNNEGTISNNTVVCTIQVGSDDHAFSQSLFVRVPTFRLLACNMFTYTFFIKCQVKCMLISLPTWNPTDCITDLLQHQKREWYKFKNIKSYIFLVLGQTQAPPLHQTKAHPLTHTHPPPIRLRLPLTHTHTHFIKLRPPYTPTSLSN